MNFVVGKQHITDSIDGKKMVYGKIFFSVRGEVDREWVFADGSYVRAHQHSSGAKGSKDESIGISCGGKTSKIHITADAHGNPIDFEITGGQVHDSSVAKNLIEKAGKAEYFIADKGYDSEDIRNFAKESGITPIIPRRTNSQKENQDFDKYLYRLRHLVENLFARLKHFRSISSRFDKLARNFKSMMYLACSYIWLKL